MTWIYDGLRPARRRTRRVAVGDVGVGGDEPIRVQSMTTPSTQDTRATVDQIERLADAGCEIVRVTVPTSKDADNLPAIREEMRRRSIRVPLVADIHFTPAAAMRAVEHVEKVRINPGNYADKKKFATREYTDAEYAGELERIEAVFAPLVLRAKELGVSMRIGTNHGSLSDRIMNRYGDTPEGMVESALEFVRICERHDYRELILSMKSSNPVVVQHVYRLLAERMAAEGMDYPFHLGVTEAGDGEDGRVKSAIGIGALLADGLGDTIRVSLTEDPVREVPVARAIVAATEAFRAPRRDGRSAGEPLVEVRDPYAYERRAADVVALGPREAGGAGTVLVETPIAARPDSPDALRRELDAQIGVRVPEETRADVVVLDAREASDADAVTALRASLATVAPGVALSIRRSSPPDDEAWWGAADRVQFPVDRASLDDAVASLTTGGARGGSALVELPDDPEVALRLLERLPGEVLRRLALAVEPRPGTSALHAYRRLAAALAGAGHANPLVLLDRSDRDDDAALVESALHLGGLLCDGIGDAIQVERPDATESRRIAFGILQAARVRITRTEFISCPSCGRTLFDLEETTARIKARTSHLKGVKIAVMGCIVNGPGEMADADFGYVGWGEDKIALFVGKEMVAKDIPTDTADERLVELIKRHGRWVDPPVPAAQDG